MKRRIAVMGLGAMGSRMARRLLEAGHEVTVWNRTAERAADLISTGAAWAESPKAAAAGSEIVISMVRDDEASRVVWLDPDHGALSALDPATVAVESSTLSAVWIGELAEAIAAQGSSLLDAPVVGSRPQAESGQLTYLVGGDPVALERTSDVLEVMGRTIHHVGAVGSGCIAKLVVNALFGVQVAALAELVTMARGAGVTSNRLMEVLATLPVTSAAVKGIGDLMVARRFEPQFPIELVEKDFGYAENAAELAGSVCPVSAAARKVYAGAAHAGLGGKNIAAVIESLEKVSGGRP